MAQARAGGSDELRLRRWLAETEDRNDILMLVGDPTWSEWTRRAVWLVLGGGGAKGFAHLGVFKALAELGVPIDGIAGSSMGAPLAGLVAMETPVDQLVGRAAEQFRRLLDYTVPLTSLIAARRLPRSIVTAADGRGIEDLWLPFLCVSTNLTRSELVVHRRGELAVSIRAASRSRG